MKYLNLLCNTFELTCLFPDAKLLESNYINNGFNTLKIQSGDNKIDINHYFDIDIFQKIQNSKNIFEIDSLYVNPSENLTIICDRQLWYKFYFPLLKNNKELFDKLEQIYVEKNVEVFFNFAILEAVNYEDEEEYFLYDFKFKHIKVSDYELFKGKKNFYYDSFYSLYHLLAEPQMNVILYPNTQNGNFEYHIDFKKIFNNFNINNKLNRFQIYSHTCLKPRYHRIKFLLEADKNDVLKCGENNVNTQFIEEYNEATKNGFIHTDNTKKHSKNHINYFNKELYEKFLKIINKINVTPDNPDFLYDHLRNYFKYEEYNNSYIDVTGETHCIFDLKYGFFTEKSIKPILAEKFVMVYGSNKVYEEFKRIGIDLFLEDFNLKGIEDKNELEQIDMIINSIKKMDKNELKKLYIKKYDTIKRNKEKLFEHYCNIMNNVNVLLLRKKENKLL
jgi:hypothetical protein